MEADLAPRLDLRRFVAPEFFFGASAIELVGQYAANQSRTGSIDDLGRCHERAF